LLIKVPKVVLIRSLHSDFQIHDPVCDRRTLKFSDDERFAVSSMNVQELMMMINHPCLSKNVRAWSVILCRDLFIGDF
jgi:hypothetical protein